jgi:uncharacterized protein (DUF433 family)
METSDISVSVPYRGTFIELWPVERIVIDLNIMGGTPVFRGTRIPVSLVASFLRAGNTPDEILREYEGRLEGEDIEAARGAMWQYWSTVAPGMTGLYSSTRRLMETFTSSTSANAFIT